MHASRQSLEALPTLRSGSVQPPLASTARGGRQTHVERRPVSGYPRAKAAAFGLSEGTAFYAVNTTNGAVRAYNEDRVSIVVNVKRRAGWSGKRWPTCSFFGIFDGHGGAVCADYLRDNLHSLILDQDCFPEDPPEAILRGCERAEADFCRFAALQTNIERSGSCALIVLIVDDRAFIGNVGDSRAIACERRGKNVVALSRDHKPEDKTEHDRIVQGGGTVSKGNGPPRALLGAAWLADLPYRVYPGGLSVARAFGDVGAKDPRLGGKTGVLIARPDVVAYRLSSDVDYLLMGCDGVFDKAPNKRLVETINRHLEERRGTDTPDRRLGLCASAVDAVIGTAVRSLSCDNLTAIFISLRAF